MKTSSGEIFDTAPLLVKLSAATQSILLLEPILRAYRTEDITSVFGSLFFAVVVLIFILLATIYRKRWARDLLAFLALGGFVMAIISGDLWATDQLDRLLAAVTSIPNIIGVALLFTPRVANWYIGGTNDPCSC